MASASVDYAHLRMSTDQIPVPDRIAFAREVFGREMLNLDLEPDPEIPLHMDFDVRILPGLKLVSGSATGVMSHRSRSMLADGNDDLFLSLNETDLFTITQRGREAALHPGDATLISCAEPVAFRRTHGNAIGISVPRVLFAHSPGVIEDQLGKLIPATSEPLRLLRFYVNSIKAEDGLQAPELRHLIVSHVHDLLLLAVNEAGEAAQQAIGGGLRAARLRQIKAHIARELTGDLSIHTIARVHHLTERYVQRLFEEEGTTFSLFVSQQRLARAFRMLQNPRHSAKPVSEIAYDCGFGDITHFNRQFRRLYGMTPRDVRARRYTSAGNDDDL